MRCGGRARGAADACLDQDLVGQYLPRMATTSSGDPQGEVQRGALAYLLNAGQLKNVAELLRRACSSG